MNLSSLPQKPGIYKFYDFQQKLLYVGKAINIKKRVTQYFKPYRKLLPKTQLMIDQTKRVEKIIVESEIEALLLEAELIKQQKPKYNHQLKDDKSFLYIHFTKEVFPRIYAARKNQIKEKGISFGPFPSSNTVYTTLKQIRRIFPYRSCSQNRFNKNKVCLYYHLNLCQGHCENKILKTNYQRQINYLKLFLKRKTIKLLRSLETEMKNYAKEEKFEKASEKKDQIEKFKYLTSGFRLPEEYLKDPNLIEDIRNQTLLNIQKIFNLPRFPIRIECYDISNFQGKQATGSMVVFTNGEPNKKEYRRFKIKIKDTPDDFGMLEEVITKRFKRRTIKEIKSWPMPDLIIIDGGKGQLSSGKKILQQLKIDIPIISLAKKKEEIYIHTEKIILDRKSKELQLIQQLRDEAHRFAISYHRKLREKKSLKN